MNPLPINLTIYKIKMNSSEFINLLKIHDLEFNFNNKSKSIKIIV